MKPTPKASICLTIFILAGCAGHSSQAPSGSLVAKALKDHPEIAYEVEASVQDQAFGEVQGTATTFHVTPRDDRYAWERTKLFFETYLKDDADQKAKTYNLESSDTSWVVNNTGIGKGRYDYIIRKTQTSDGFDYSVLCNPRTGADAASAVVNARNLARFIDTGNLEVALIVR